MPRKVSLKSFPNELEKALLMKQSSSFIYRYLIPLTVLFTTIIVIFVSFQHHPIKSLTNDFKEPYIFNTAQIQYTGEKPVPIDLPAVIETNQPYSIFLDMTPVIIGPTGTLFVHVIYTDLEIWVNGKQVYDYKVPKDEPVRSGGYAIHLVELPGKIQNPYIELRFTPLLRPFYKQYNIVPMEYGMRTNILNHHLIRKIFGPTYLS